MAVENGWGQGTVNNTNDWGKAKVNSTNGFGKIYENTNAGLTNIIGGAGGFLNTKSVQYDGIDSRAETSTNYSEFDGETKGTFSFWFKCNGSFSNSHDTVVKVGPPYGRRTFEIELIIGNQVQFVFSIAQSGSGRRVYANIGNFRQDGLWHHIMFCADLSLSTTSDRTKLFVDGSPITLISGINYPFFPSQRYILTVGGTTEGNKSFKGSLDEVALWQGVDLRNNISTIYNSGTASDLNNNGLTPPITWYRMGDNDTYPTLNDNGTSGYNLTLINADPSDIVEDAPS